MSAKCPDCGSHMEYINGIPVCPECNDVEDMNKCLESEHWEQDHDYTSPK